MYKTRIQYVECTHSHLIKDVGMCMYIDIWYSGKSNSHISIYTTHDKECTYIRMYIYMYLCKYCYS